MKKKNLERILNFIREEMMTTGSNVNTAGFSSKAPAKGPTAGFDPVIGKVKKRKPTPLGRYRTRVNWRQNDES
tara:strand:- start:106 stop:324 length:219 start_codon:yes stop_codon:yes gene_type:complete